jgi:S1-C subfamily serine protease
MRTNKNSLGAGIFLLLLCLLIGGCIHDSTAEKRDASFLPYVRARVGQVTLRDFLLARSAMLFRADEFVVTPSSDDSRSGQSTGGVLSFGTAAAIDRRGYFLTAAHCVAKDPLKLVYLENGQLQARSARVVWRGDVSKKQPDLAILRVSVPLQNVFSWTSEFTNGDSVAALGLLFFAHCVKTQCMAGKVLGRAEGSESVLPHYGRIVHDVPLRRGDSGGPLVSMDGRLIGINVSFDTSIQWKSLTSEPVSGTAERPDLDWLKQLIEQDVATQSGAKPW